MNAERIVLLGWGRAILLQLAHPLIAAGVYDHSSFRATPWAAATRLYHTVHAMLALTFGDSEEHERALEGIRSIHRRVHGLLATDVGPFPAGTCYSAEDPALVLWVHATLLESVPLVYGLLVRPLSESELDAYCAEAAPVAIALAARPADVPRTWADARAYLDRMYASDVLTVSDQAREIARAVLAPRGPLAGPLSWGNRLLTRGFLPPAFRAQYGLRWTPGDRRAFATLIPTLRIARRLLPSNIATWRQSRR